MRFFFVDAPEEDRDEPSSSSSVRRRNHVKRRRGKVEKWPDESIVDMQLRRYLLRDTALEVNVGVVETS
jgi:hypothetical protein